MRHKSKRYKTYLLESAEHNNSIMKKYGMPPKAKPPHLDEDIIDRITKENSFTAKDWNGHRP